ncbi:prepilin-type N-terminal cleavage/methylation domain-containing protein, partial [Desulfobotulus sp.]|uniref:prepilin-type N-terminal cleavage/methylation domain-containing protein n=1 Tax=Desulfobotulus sp. TaxID=1940337 RepID=UPI002A36C4A4
MEQRKSLMRNQEGFTLIEIIAVLVLLGILAAVAVPRYFDMQTEAKAKATKAQVAEIKSNLNMGYAKAVLNGTSSITGATVLDEAGFGTGGTLTMGTSPDLWAVTLSSTDNAVTIKITARDGDTAYNNGGGDVWNVPTSSAVTAPPTP